MRRVLSREKVRHDPDLLWNEFIDLIASSKASELDAIQRTARLAFLYDSEVLNGGHLQYFNNQATELIGDTVLALLTIGASKHAELLRSAASRWLSRQRKRPESLEDYASNARESEFADLDTNYYDLKPDITALLEEWLKSNLSAFIELND